MYEEFKAMCQMSGIPAPPPELARAMMMGSVNEAMAEEDMDPAMREQMEKVGGGVAAPAATHASRRRSRAPWPASCRRWRVASRA